MGLFDSSDACLSLNKTLVYEFLFILWLPTAIISGASVLFVIILTVQKFCMFRRLKEDEDLPFKMAIGTCAVAMLVGLSSLYVIAVHIIALIPLAVGVLNDASSGVLLISLISNIHFCGLLLPVSAVPVSK